MGFFKVLKKYLKRLESAVVNAVKKSRSNYRPERHYMRGPGPATQARNPKGPEQQAGRM